MLAALGDGGQRKLCQMWVEVPSAAHELVRQSSQEVRPPTGEPDAGDPPVRFGGRGGRNQSSLPTPIEFEGFAIPFNSIEAGDYGSAARCRPTTSSANAWMSATSSSSVKRPEAPKCPADMRVT